MITVLTWVLARPSSKPRCRLASSVGTCVSVARGVRARRRAPESRWPTPKILSGRMGRWPPRLALLLPEQVTSHWGLQPVQVVPSKVDTRPVMLPRPDLCALKQATLARPSNSRRQGLWPVSHGA